MTHISPIQQRLRITFGKYGPLKYTSNLDLAKVWERTLRRANLPILYTQGFNTRPRIQLACPLPVGITSECEILDIALRETIELDELAEKISAVSPTGLEIMRIESVPIHASALQSLVRSAEYRIHFEDGVNLSLLKEKIDQLLTQSQLVTSKDRKGRKTVYDLRPLIYALHLDEAGDLIAHLAVGDRGNLRPEELLALLELEDAFVSIHRFRLHIENQ